MNIRKCREKSGRFVYLRFVHIFIEERSGGYHIRFQPGERGEDMPISLFFSTVCGRIDILSEPGITMFSTRHLRCTIFEDCEIFAFLTRHWKAR